MKAFVVTTKEGTEKTYARTKGDLKNMLRHKLKKRRLVGIKIEEKGNNNYKGYSNIKLIAPLKKKDSCCYCDESRNEELTIDDSLVARVVCEKCLKEKQK